MWLEQKAESARVERKSDTRLQKTLENELEWMKSNAKAKQTKSKARLARYEEMLLAPQREELSHTASIYIPPGPRLGQQARAPARLPAPYPAAVAAAAANPNPNPEPEPVPKPEPEPRART